MRPIDEIKKAFAEAQRELHIRNQAVHLQQGRVNELADELFAAIDALPATRDPLHPIIPLQLPAPAPEK